MLLWPPVSGFVFLCFFWAFFSLSLSLFFCRFHFAHAERQCLTLPPCPLLFKNVRAFRFVIQFILKVMSPVVYTQVKKLLETEFGGDTVRCTRENDV